MSKTTEAPGSPQRVNKAIARAVKLSRQLNEACADVDAEVRCSHSDDGSYLWWLSGDLRKAAELTHSMATSLEGYSQQSK